MTARTRSRACPTPRKAATTIAFLAAVTGVTLGSARAAFRPFVYGGGQTLSTEKEDTDRLLNPITIDDRTGTWEAGFGARFYSKLNLHGNGQPKWEIRPRLGWSSGDLAGTTVTVKREDRRNPYEYTFREDFTWDSWQVGTQFLVNVRPGIGFLAGPVLQSVSFKAERDWEGSIPQFCSSCGDGRDKIGVRYGLLEVGAHLMPFPMPLAIETYWIPKRFELSTSRKGQGDYKANFATLANSFGGRVTYDF
ncbi:MAG: hypothetical protein IPK72_02095 [Candidatus Eisenbacteria bacterium]|nr:hypothetical protein [Candidatus Eisenbacteria bacterium]